MNGDASLQVMHRPSVSAAMVAVEVAIFTLSPSSPKRPDADVTDGLRCPATSARRSTARGLAVVGPARLGVQGERPVGEVGPG